MRLIGALIFSILGLILATYISVDWGSKSAKQPEPVLTNWDYKLNELKRFNGYKSKLYQGEGGKCYLLIKEYNITALSLVNCSDFMEIDNG